MSPVYHKNSFEGASFHSSNKISTKKELQNEFSICFAQERSAMLSARPLMKTNFKRGRKCWKCLQKFDAPLGFSEALSKI